METGDTVLLGAIIGVVMALIEVIKIFAKKKNGDGNAALTRINQEQLNTLHSIDKEIAGVRHEMRSLWTAHNHLDRKVDALHRRFDSARRTATDAQ